MADVLSWPMGRHPVQPTLSALWEVPSPHTPLAFWELEQQVQSTAGQVADQIVGHHLTQVHQEPDFVRQAVAQARAKSEVPLVNKGLKPVSVLLSGGTRFVLENALSAPQTDQETRPQTDQTRA